MGGYGRSTTRRGREVGLGCNKERTNVGRKQNWGNGGKEVGGGGKEDRKEIQKKTGRGREGGKV